MNLPELVHETGKKCISDVNILSAISNMCISVVQMVRLRNMPKVLFGVIGCLCGGDFFRLENSKKTDIVKPRP